MAKLTALAAVNQVLTNIGEPTVSALTSLTGIQLLAFNTLNELIYSIGAERLWNPLEASGTATLTTGTATFSEASDIMVENEYSFTLPDNSSTIELKTPTAWAMDYPAGIGTATTGWATAVKREGGYFYLNKYPTATQNSKTVQYKYWKVPTAYSTATATGTCWFPEGMDMSVLCNLATFRLLHYKGSPEAQFYHAIVYGTNPINDPGSMATMNKRYSCDSGRLQVQVTNAI